MSKTVLIQLTTAGPGTGPFDLYCVDIFGNITGPFETNVPKSELVAGFTSPNACDDIAAVKIISKSTLCNGDDIILSLP